MDAKTLPFTPTPRADQPQVPPAADPGCRQCRQCGLLLLAYPFRRPGRRGWRAKDGAPDPSWPNRPGDRASWNRDGVVCDAGLDPTAALDEWHICTVWERP